MAIATRPIHPSGWLKSSEIRSRCYLALMDLADVNAITTAVANWAIERDDIRAMAMLGSWVRGNPRPASDLDLLLLSDLAPDYQRFRTWLTEIDFQNAGFRLRSSESAIYGVISFPAAVILLHKAIPWTKGPADGLRRSSRIKNWPRRPSISRRRFRVGREREGHEHFVVVFASDL
jgi:hypothetical protein